MHSPETVTEAVQQLQAEGYDGDFRLDASGVHCGACGAGHQPESLRVTQTYRYEGNTDPGDESVVFGIVCPDCAARGIVVSAYGPDADPEIFAMLTRLGTR
jgi:hypothetical protein